MAARSLLGTLALLLALAGAPDAAASGKVNVNTASAAELARVPGLDSQVAVRIVARRASRPFKSLDELLEIPGITKLTMISAAEHLEAGPAAAPAPVPVAPAASARKLDLNKATFAELLLLPEMTPRTAKAILDYREKKGAFQSIDELGAIPGIDKRAAITLLDRVVVKTTERATAAATPRPAGDGNTIVLGDEPWVAKAETPRPAPTATPRPLALGERIDLNSATRAELERLPDIGPVMAQRIIDYRRANGPFDSTEELLGVRGIGQTRLTALRPHVVVGGGSRGQTPRTTPAPAPTRVAIATPKATPAVTKAAKQEPTKVAALVARPAITPDGRVNINVAGVEELLTLPRMTREVAQEIVNHRAKNGPFRDPHSIVDVPSIGEAFYARVRDKIVAE